MPLAQLKKYAQNGLIVSSAQLPGLNEDRKREIDNIISSRPNPLEREQWEKVSSLAAGAATDEQAQEQVLLALEEYISDWENLRPVGNNVDRAIAMADDLKEKVNRIRAAAEEADWQQVWDVRGGTIEALTGHLDKYPHSIHSAEIDDAIWMELLRLPERLETARRYRELFPNGAHISDVRDIENAARKWEDIKAYADPLQVKQYMNENPYSPFLEEARFLLSDLKHAELERMRDEGDAYDAQNLLALVDNAVFTENELIAARVIERGDINDIRSIAYERDQLPDISSEISRCRRETAEGCTDVFLFGIPSTGKSCILMGLINSPKLNYNSVHGAGSYAGALSQYVAAGVTIPRTPGDFIATIQASIVTEDAQHPVNLVEMSGEEFAFKLAANENQHISFADMGAGAPELLRNKNRKIFFIIIDPTTTNVRFPHAMPMTDEYGRPVLNAEGQQIYEPRWFNLNQRIMLEKIIDVLMDPENKDVMEKVDAIHFIVTKADILDKNTSGNDRETEAYNRFLANFGNKIQTLIRFCQANDINATSDKRTNGHPRLYTFSLGNFKIGGYFRYNSYDSDKLIDVIMENTGAVREEKFIDRFLRIVNQPIF